MPYLILTCDFCGKPANGKSTRTIGLCEDHANRVNSIPKVSGKRLSIHAAGNPVTPTFGGGTGFKKSGIRGSGF